MSAYEILSPVLRRGGSGRLYFHCPGCGYPHGVNVDKVGEPKWSYNGDPGKPTFSPSILVTTGRAVDPTFEKEEGDPPAVCHTFVREGKIQFLSDCDHVLAGQTVNIPVWPED